MCLNIERFMGRRPRIAITMRLELESRRFYLGRDYSEVIERCGGIPVHLGLIPNPEYIEQALADVDGVLLPGSNTDVDPYSYGQEPHHHLGVVIPEKDQTDMLVLDEVEGRNLPLLAICYGMQALNVSRGGTLIQDIESQIAGSFKHEQGNPTNRNSHGIVIKDGSVLSSLNAVAAARSDIRVNSSHHQAIGDLGRNLNAVAWAKDGVIECIEDSREGRFVLGLQWHPELTAGHDPISHELFALFVEKAMNSAEGQLKRANNV